LRAISAGSARFMRLQASKRAYSRAPKRRSKL
jgi:hypothetical protein